MNKYKIQLANSNIFATLNQNEIRINRIIKARKQPIKGKGGKGFIRPSTSPAGAGYFL